MSIHSFVQKRDLDLLEVHKKGWIKIIDIKCVYL